MNLSFRPTDYCSDQDCEAIARWMNDPVLRDLWLTKGAKSAAPATAELVRVKHTMNPKSGFHPIRDELAILNGQVVGQYTLILNPPHRKSTAERVLWPSLIIGEKGLRGSGVLRRFLERIKVMAGELGVSHIEVGVFEFNRPMRSLLEKTGFREFARVEDATEAGGRLWADIRYMREI